MESIYEKALRIELSKRGLKFDYQREIRIEYLGVEVGTHKLDLLVENTIIVELKAVKELSDIHFAQLRSYLKAANLKVGLLLNFSKPTLEVNPVRFHRGHYTPCEKAEKYFGYHPHASARGILTG